MALTARVTPLLGSLGLHGCALLLLFVAVRRPASLSAWHRERPDAWLGNALEVDAVATPEATPGAAPTAVERKSAEPETAKTPAPAAANLPPRPRPAPAATRARASANAAGALPGPIAGAFGAEGLPPGVRSLASAFTRAIPPATGADPIWQSLATGVEKPFTIAIEVDAEGHISSAEILPESDGSAVEPQFAHLRERVVALLGAGLFALQDNVSAGRELFRITVTLSDRAARDDDAPAELVERGFDPPRAGAPGRAYFTLASGRHFEAKVDILRASGRK